MLNGLPKALAVKNSPAKICEFDPWVRKILWRRKWQLTPEFLPGKFHGQKNLVGYSQVDKFLNAKIPNFEWEKLK